MRNVWLVIKHEVLSMVSKPSFWVTTFLIPLLVLAVNTGSQTLSQTVIESVKSEQETRVEQPVTGYVDHAGLISTIPEDVDAESLREFASESAAHTALEKGDIARYYIVREDFVRSGHVTVVTKDFLGPDALSPAINSDLGLFQYVLNVNLVGDAKKAAVVSHPIVNFTTASLAPEPESSQRDGIAASAVPYAIMMIFFFVFSMSSSFMLRSVTSEKENRTIEVLLLSLRPRELMLGKLLALGMMALLQVIIWVGGGMLLLNRGAAMFSALGSFEFPPLFWAWLVAYSVLGYFLYASALGAIGALAPSARETGSFTFIVMLPLMIPLWFNVMLIDSPHGTGAIALSLFPLTAPLTMLTRLVATEVPIWQTLVSLLGLAVTTYGFVLLSARFFRADTLLSGATLDRARFFKELKSALSKS